MNNYTLALSSNNTEYISVNPLLEFDDFTTLTIDLSGLNTSLIPKYLKISWGDGEEESFDNDIFPNNQRKVNVFNINSIFNTSYKHEYYPSKTSLYKKLSAQVLVNYTNGDNNWFIIPINIRTYDYYESIYDLSLKNTNILPITDNSKQHQFITDKGGFTVELQG
jgi:hypothetical protein